MRLGMNLELERLVMDTMYLAHHIYQKNHLFFNEISELSGVKKSSLQRVLPRLVSRGWIKNEKVSLLPGNTWVRFILKHKTTKRMGYKVVEYPFLQRKSAGGHVPADYNVIAPEWNYPNGTKRFWKKSAKEMRILRDEFFSMEIKRVNLRKMALATMYPHKYKFPEDTN